MTDIESVYVQDIHVGDRLRHINRDTVEALKKSISRIGLKVPISIRLISEVEGYALVAGLHRLQACCELDMAEVPVREETGTDADARMWEIAENLHRAELTVIERAEHIEEWRKLTTDKGSQLATPVAGGTQPEARGIKATARDLGVTVREVERAEKIAGIDAAAKTEAKALGLDDNQSALLKAAAEPTPEAQKQKLQQHAAKPRKERKPKAQSTPTIDGEPADRPRQHDDLLRMLYLANVHRWPERERVQFALDVIAALGLVLDDLQPVGGA
jgi:ParB-like chromosome segregation protein Spo0J